ncbi:hypothetical protein OG339_01690 [Streptosporangium sp. NBC_01495]|uniref:hypothetical protein n=1 Tax=Streptosporangium sp. NBC_01495 TaxID=2903899 RepID=UPI002E304485|nr:hypothetical protein [Streptosporangium sp. NBC_01495]
MTAGQSLAEGAAGIALLHLEVGRWEAAYAALEQAIADGVSGATLYPADALPPAPAVGRIFRKQRTQLVMLWQ